MNAFPELYPIFLAILAVAAALTIAIFYLSEPDNNKHTKNNEGFFDFSSDKHISINNGRTEYTAFLRSVIEAANLKIEGFNSLTNFKNGFASGYKIFMWQSSFFDGQLKTGKFLDYENSFLNDDEKAVFRRFLEIKNNYKNLIKTYNKDFVLQELQKTALFLSDIDGKSLDDQQRFAVVSEEDNTLVVAGAGSGKTTTIAGKVAYLVFQKHISPEDILLISFTRKSSDEMKERIKRKMHIDVDVKTFNKLGLDIIKDVEGQNQKSVCGLSDQEINELFQSFFEFHLKDPTYLKKFNEYFLYSSQPYKAAELFSSARDYSTYIKDANPVGFKKITKVNKDGVEYSYREKLKSFEEVEIANFLYFNRIEYEYESGYTVKTASEKFGQYKPDFFLPDYNIYIEHFGIDRQGNVPDWFTGDEYQTAKEKYNNGITWKRELHAANNTTLVETYSYQKKEGSILNILQEKLISLGVIFNPYTDEEILEIIKNSDKFQLREFTKLLITFTNLFKSNRLDVTTFENGLIGQSDTRTLEFYQLFQPIYYSYQSFLEQRSEIDFTDMINIATDYVRENKYSKTYQYIIIDEFQDISIGRYDLVKSLLDLSPKTKLFCVGDDWQSIYRFSGSDISIFAAFPKYFTSTLLGEYKRQSQILNIEKTYRFKQDLIEDTSKFILKNKSQLKKELVSARPADDIKSIKFLVNNSTNSFADFVVAAISGLYVDLHFRDENIDDKSIIFLGRYSHDLDKLRNSDEFKISRNRSDGTVLVSVQSLRTKPIPFLTVHSAKGIEADYVFVLNVDGGKYGFPSQIADDPVLHHLLSHSDQHPNSEERRLFYVALTRCKEQVFLLTEKDNESSFFNELKGVNSENLICPWCETGALHIKKGRYGPFYSCDNYNFCNYSSKVNYFTIIAKATELRKQNKNNRAIELFNVVHDNHPLEYDIYTERGLAYYNEKLYDTAIECFLTSYRKFNDTTVLIYLSNCYYHIKDYDEALGYANEYQKKYPDNPTIYNNKAVFNYVLKNYRESIKDFEYAIKIGFADSESIQNTIATCHNRLGNYATALVTFENAKIKGYEIDVREYNIAIEKNLLLNSTPFLDSNQAELSLEKEENKYKLSDDYAPQNFVDAEDYYADFYDLEYEEFRNSLNWTEIEYLENQILNSIKNEKHIKFNYRKNESFSLGEQSLRTILPKEVKVVGKSNSVCVMGYCYLRKEDRTFALERITNLVVDPEAIEFSE